MSQFEFILAREAQLMYRRARGFEPIAGNLSRWRGVIPGRNHHKDIQFEVEILIPPEFPRKPPQVKMITPTDHPQVDPKTGDLNLRILTYWRPEYHLYQVINSIKGLFARIPPNLPDTFTSTLMAATSQAKITKTAEPPPLPPQPISESSQIALPSPPAEPEIPLIREESPKIRDLKSQISHLESELVDLQKSMITKEEEVARLEGRMDAHNVPRHGQVNGILLPQDPKDKQLLDLQSEKIALEDLIRTLENKFEFGEISSAEYAKLYKAYQKKLFIIKQKLKELNNT